MNVSSNANLCSHEHIKSDIMKQVLDIIVVSFRWLEQDILEEEYLTENPVPFTQLESHATLSNLASLVGLFHCSRNRVKLGWAELSSFVLKVPVHNICSAEDSHTKLRNIPMMYSMADPVIPIRSVSAPLFHMFFLAIFPLNAPIANRKSREAISEASTACSLDAKRR